MGEREQNLAGTVAVRPTAEPPLIAKGPRGNVGKLVRDGTVVASGQVVSQAMTFARTVILAHMLSKGDLGIAVLFQTSMSLLDMISDLNVGTLLIQSKDGDDPVLQRTGHAISATRGLAMAAVMALLAWPLADLFDVPDARWAFQLVAIVPFMRGFGHSDISRLQRYTRYIPAAASDAGAQVVATALAWPIAYVTRDYSAMMWVLVIQAGTGLVLTHILAERRYGFAWDRACAGRMLSFGWPLLVNGLLMFGIFQGDRFIIGAERLFPAYTKEDLGLYSVAFSLVLVPTLIFTRISYSLVLPRLSRLRPNEPEFRERARLTMQAFALAGAAVAAVFIVAGGTLTAMIYGRQYADVGAFIGWLAVAQGLRLARVGTTIVALSRGDSKNSMHANLARGIAIVAVVVAAWFGKGLVWIAACGVAGEILAAAVSSAGVVRKKYMGPADCIFPMLACAAAIAVAVLIGIVPAGRIGQVAAVALAVVSAVICVIAGSVFCKQLRHQLWGLLSGGSTLSRRFAGARPGER